MIPSDLETRLAGRRDSATVAAVIHELHADPDWTVTEVMLERRIVAVEMLHHPSGTAYTLSRRVTGDSLHKSEGR